MQVINSPGCLRWRGEVERVSSVCCHICFSPCPLRLKPCFGSGLAHPGQTPCPCDSLCVCLQNLGSQWALGCASAPGILGSPSHRHSPPCIYYKVFFFFKKMENKEKWNNLHLWFGISFAKFTTFNSPVAIVEIKPDCDLCAFCDGPQWINV